MNARPTKAQIDAEISAALVGAPLVRVAPANAETVRDAARAHYRADRRAERGQRAVSRANDAESASERAREAWGCARANGASDAAAWEEVDYSRRRY